MTEWMRSPGAGRRRTAADRQPDRLDARVHADPVRRLGRVLHRYVLVRFRQSRHPVAELHRRQVARLELARGRRAGGRSWCCCSPSRSRSGRRGSPTFRPTAKRWSCSVAGEQFAWNVHYPGPDGVFGKHRHQADRRPGEPAGARPHRPGRQGRRHDAQSAPPAGRTSRSIVQAQEQGRHPQLRRAGDAGEAGRHPRPDDPGLVRAHRHHRRDAAAERATPSSSTRSPARSSAASATTGCAASSPSMSADGVRRSGWTNGSKELASPDPFNSCTVYQLQLPSYPAPQASVSSVQSLAGNWITGTTGS